MKKLLVCAALAMLPCAELSAATWVAKLDGIQGAPSAGLQFNFGTQKGDPAIIYFKTMRTGSGEGGIIEIARGVVTSVSPNEIMATFKHQKGASNQPLSRVTINRQQRSVNVLYHSPNSNQENFKDVFGVGSVTVVP